LFKSSGTSFFHRFFERLLDLIPMGFHSVIFLTGFVLFYPVKMSPPLYPLRSYVFNYIFFCPIHNYFLFSILLQFELDRASFLISVFQMQVSCLHLVLIMSRFHSHKFAFLFFIIPCFFSVGNARLGNPTVQ
jgi:hypothetical protein